MKAALATRYGPAGVVTIAEIPTPEAGPGEVLVEVHASSVTTADWRLRASAFPGGLWLPGRLVAGLLRPRHPVLGSDFSGRVAALGAGATGFAVGDAVFGYAGHGAHAEVLAMRATGAIAQRPAGLSHREAAALPWGALAALGFLRDVLKLRAGQRILIVGASGGVGAYAVQIARHMGAEVTGVASGANRDLVVSLGADRFRDYRTESILDNADRYDAIFDTVGALTFREARKSLTDKGIFAPLNYSVGDVFRALRSGMGSGPTMRIAVSGDRPTDLDEIGRMVETGALRPVVDRVYGLDDIAAAHAHVESRHRRGAVVLGIRPEAVPAAAAA
jgi:NADPH:quinone reductase-like Zn-dependent oxidoreductase